MINFIDPVAFLGIRWYAIFILLGLVIAVFMGIKEGKRLGIYEDFVFWGVIICVPCSIIGARLWYVLFNLDDFDSFLDVLGITSGGLSGLAIQGGVIVAVIFVIIWSKKHNISVYRVFDILAPGLLIGQICGRWGNFCNHELYGPIVQTKWLAKFIYNIPIVGKNMCFTGMGDAAQASTNLANLHHPTFLYESFLNLIGFILILVGRRKYKKLQSGDLLGFYLVWYGLVRIVTETLRSQSGANEILKLGPIPVSIAMSVIFIICGVVFLIIKRFKGPKEYYQDILAQVESEKFDCILFDLDGTLLNTRPLIDASFINTFNYFMPEHVLTDEELESFFGPPLKTTFQRYSDDPKKVDEMIAYYREYNKANHDAIVKPFDGCAELLKKLSKKGYKLGIVSSKKREVVLMGTDLCKITPYIQTFVCEDEVSEAKPSPEGINKAIKNLYPDVKLIDGKYYNDQHELRIMYVGDHPNDILAGKNAGIFTTAVMYSNKSEELDQANPNYEVEGLLDILKILNE